jgi:hypothetical protein
VTGSLVTDGPRPRLLACVERWPECEEGTYDPRCCRFPKSCSCTVYDEEAYDAQDRKRLHGC